MEGTGFVEIEEVSAGEWRTKDVKRFENPDLVSVFYETQRREVFDYHEAICDRLFLERENCTKVSLFTLARTIHDDHGWTDAEWFMTRRSIFLTLRDRGLICFNGSIDSVHQELEISVPERTYRRWRMGGDWRAEKAAAQPRENGRFAKKRPAHTADHRNGTATSRNEPQATAKDSDADKDVESTTTSTSNEDPARPPAVVIPTTIARDTAGTPYVVDGWTAELRAAFSWLHQGDSSKAFQITRQVLKHKRKYENQHLTPEAYIKAAKSLGEQAAEGWRPDPGKSPMAYYLTTIESHLVELDMPDVAPRSRGLSKADILAIGAGQ